MWNKIKKTINKNISQDDVNVATDEETKAAIINMTKDKERNTLKKNFGTEKFII